VSMSLSAKRSAYSDMPSVLSQSTTSGIAAPPRGYRGLTALLDQGDREFNRQFPSGVDRLTEPAKQMPLA
jgi:hypothetical protein